MVVTMAFSRVVWKDLFVVVYSEKKLEYGLAV